MRSYGKVYTAFWTDPKMIGLSNNAKLLALYLLTGPHSNSIGCYRLPTGYIMADLNLEPEEADDVIAEMESVGFIVRCRKTGWTLIVNYLRHNPPENGNVGRSMVPLIDAVPRSSAVWNGFLSSLRPFHNRFPDGYIANMEAVCKAPVETVPETVSETVSESVSDTTKCKSKTPEPEPIPEPNQASGEVLELSTLAARAADTDDADDDGLGVGTVAAAIADAFEEFWREYPKRGGAGNPRKPASERFGRLVRRGIKAADIIAGTKAYAAAMRQSGKTGTEFVLQATTFLNQERWKDFANVEHFPTGRPVDPEIAEIKARHAAMGTLK